MRESTQPKILVICGPTATGKTDLALKLAKGFNGELVSADSRQVYKYMDIGTGKDLPVNSKFQMTNYKFIKNTSPNGLCFRSRENKNFQVGYYLFDEIPVWLLDVVTPKEQFSVATYYQLAWKVIEDIWQRGKLPILVGGTGFYIKAVLEGIETLGVAPDKKLRERLENLTVSQLQEELKKLDHTRFLKMNSSDCQNPRRLIRAVEIAQQKKKKGSVVMYQYITTQKPDVLYIGLTAPKEVLYQKINERVDRRLKQGMIEEVENLLKMGVTHERLYDFGLEYRYIDEYLQGLTTQEEMIQKLKFKIHDFARRQLTWFRKEPKICWFDITKPKMLGKVEAYVEKWYNLRSKLHKPKAKYNKHKDANQD